MIPHCSAHAVRRPCGLRDIADVADVIVGCACCLPRADTGERELAGTHKQRLLANCMIAYGAKPSTDRRRLLGVPRPYLRLLSDVCLPGYLTSNGSRILCYLEEGAEPAAGSAGARPVGRPHGPRPGFSDETKAGARRVKAALRPSYRSGAVLPRLAGKFLALREEFMRKCALSAVLASVMLTTGVSLPNQANGMTISILSGTAPAQIEQAGWCGGRRGCLGRSYYQSPPPYAYYSYRPWPYYNYFLGSGWPTYGWYR